MLFMLVASAGKAFGAVISFDDLSPAPPSPGGQGLTVNAQYSGQGVTFNDLDAFTYSPGFAHSPNVAAEPPCVGVEFCTAPVRADFTALQDNVRVWVGTTYPTVDPLPVRLTAFDASSAVVGTANATVGPSGSPIPVQTELALDPPGAPIARIEVARVENGSPAGAAGLAVDDVEFSTVGPPPPCTATGPPTVAVAEPAGGLSVQNNSFILRGTINARSAPITSATVVAGSATTRTANVYPTLIDADGGTFGPINFNGLLSPGGNDLVVTATNCAGTGSSAARRVNLSPIDAGTHFQQLGRIEVSQTVQQTDNPVPLIAATPNGVKRTFARVYLGLTGGASPVSSITGRLTAIRPDGSRPGGPLSIPSLNTLTIGPAATAESARAKLIDSLNFELPPEWLTAGPLHLQLDRLEVEGAQSPMPCDDCANLLGNGTPALVRFHTVPPVRIWLVRVPYEATPGATPSVPSQFEIDMLASWLRRAYPTAEVRDTQMFMPVQPGPPGALDDDGDRIRPGFLCNDLNSRLSEWVSSMQAQDPRTRYYGVVSDAGGNFMRGCGNIGGRFGSGPSGNGSFGWDGDGAYTDWYGGHEIGHMYGRLHPDGGCEDSDDDDDFPFLGGLIGDGVFDAQGLDAGDAALGLPLQLNDWRASWADVMTYCENQWMSSYTYRGILRNLCNADQPSCPDRAQLSGPAGAAAARMGGASPPDLRRKGGGRSLAVSGSLSQRNGRLSLAPLAALPGLTLTERPRKSRYSIELRGPGRRVLASYPFEPEVVSDMPPGEGQASIEEVVPFKAGTRQIVIERGGTTLESVAVSAHAPKVKLLRTKGKNATSSTRVRWRSSDADGDRRTFALLYSPDGKSYVPVAAGLRKQSYRVDLSRLPGGSKARFRVIATDGVLTDISTSKKSLNVPVKSPRVSISTPLTGAALVEGQPVQFVATVDDLQDPRFPAANVVWQSSLQGELGRGTAISASLTPGTHEITASATNSGGQTTVASISVEVAAVPPDFDASP